MIDCDDSCLYAILISEGAAMMETFTSNPIQSDGNLLKLKGYLISVVSPEMQKQSAVKQPGRDGIRKLLLEAYNRTKVELKAEVRDQVIDSALAELVGYGPLEVLLAEAEISEIMVNGANKVFVERNGEVLETDIRSTGFYRNKARSIQGACRMILETFHGKVPDTMEELIQLPGVARKTANVVLGVVWGKAEGIVVDTHVHRVSRRLELTAEDAPERIERDLMGLVPRSKGIGFSHEMILHGRRVCRSRSPMCYACPVENICRSTDKVTALPLSLAGEEKRSRAPGRRP